MNRKKLYKTRRKVCLKNMNGKTKIMISNPFSIGYLKFLTEYVQNI